MATHVELFEEGLWTRVQIPPAPPHTGDRFSLSPLFLSWKGLFLRAFAFFLVDAKGQISPIFVLRDHISLFFLSWLVDVSIS